MGKPAIVPEDYPILRKFWLADEPADRIAKLFGVHQRTLQAYVKQLDLPPRRPPMEKKMPDDEQFIEDFQHYTPKEMSRRYKVHIQVVYNKINKLGLKKKDFGGSSTYGDGARVLQEWPAHVRFDNHMADKSDVEMIKRRMGLIR